MRELAERLVREGGLTIPQYCTLLAQCDSDTLDYLRREAVRTARQRFGCGIFIRGLIEIGSYCHRDCLYCGLRRSNHSALRYRLSDEQIVESCRRGYAMGLRTFVLQSGEDAWWSDERVCRVIKAIRESCPDAAITLSLGERSEASYERLFKAGASRYLLRHEAADKTLYEKIHPADMSYDNRMECVAALQRVGYQTGVGMMIGVAGQSVESIAADIDYIARIRPQMIGVGPFIPSKGTPFAENPAGDLQMTLLVLAIIRLVQPDALIPATTALATLSKEGRAQAILSGANVVMPNLTPVAEREKYAIYDDKAALGAESIEGLADLEREFGSIGYHIDFSRGDFKKF